MSKGRVALERGHLGHGNWRRKTPGWRRCRREELRYDRADEVLEACFALWNSWDADAPRERQGGRRDGRPGKGCTTPTTPGAGSGRAARSPSRAARRVARFIMQAGSSDRGREFAARWAEVIFTIQRGAAEMREFYDDMKGRLAAKGRAPNECAILPAISVVLARNRLHRGRAGRLPRQPGGPGTDPRCRIQQPRRGPDQARHRRHAGASCRATRASTGRSNWSRQVMRADGVSLAEAVAKRGTGRCPGRHGDGYRGPYAGAVRGGRLRRLRPDADHVPGHVRAILPFRRPGVATPAACSGRNTPAAPWRENLRADR